MPPAQKKKKKKRQETSPLEERPTVRHEEVPKDAALGQQAEANSQPKAAISQEAESDGIANAPIGHQADGQANCVVGGEDAASAPRKAPHAT